MTIRMLIEGHSDPVSAKRLGVSARTYAGYVADLKEEYDAETRFQLGYAMGQMGVSGHERRRDDGRATTNDGTATEIAALACSRRPGGGAGTDRVGGESGPVSAVVWSVAAVAGPLAGAGQPQLVSA